MKPEPGGAAGTGFAVLCDDGVALNALLFAATDAADTTIIICAALGVPQHFYADMARFLAAQGFNAVTFDYRGIAGSGQPLPKGREILFSHWGQRDTDAVLKAVAENLQPTHTVLLGHSAGGQLFGLSRRCKSLSAAVIVSSLNPHFRHYRMPRKALIWLLFALVLPLFSLGRDRFPARLLSISSVDIPAGVMRQWARLGRLRGYLWDQAAGLDTRHYARFSAPLLVCHIDDDGHAPWRGIEDLLARFPSAPKHLWKIKSADVAGGQIGHLNFFRSRVAGALWPELLGQIRSLLASRRPVDYV